MPFALVSPIFRSFHGLFTKQVLLERAIRSGEEPWPRRRLPQAATCRRELRWSELAPDFKRQGGDSLRRGWKHKLVADGLLPAWMASATAPRSQISLKRCRCADMVSSCGAGLLWPSDARRRPVPWRCLPPHTQPVLGTSKERKKTKKIVNKSLQKGKHP